MPSWLIEAVRTFSGKVPNRMICGGQDGLIAESGWVGEGLSVIFGVPGAGGSPLPHPGNAVCTSLLKTPWGPSTAAAIDNSCASLGAVIDVPHHRLCFFLAVGEKSLTDCQYFNCNSTLLAELNRSQKQFPPDTRDTSGPSAQGNAVLIPT